MMNQKHTGQSGRTIEIATRPRWKRVWFYWKALERFEGKPMSKMTLDEVKSIYGD
jgi:hypothetical protein